MLNYDETVQSEEGIWKYVVVHKLLLVAYRVARASICFMGAGWGGERKVKFLKKVTSAVGHKNMNEENLSSWKLIRIHTQTVGLGI